MIWTFADPYIGPGRHPALFLKLRAKMLLKVLLTFKFLHQNGQEGRLPFNPRLHQDVDTACGLLSCIRERPPERNCSPATKNCHQHWTMISIYKIVLVSLIFWYVCLLVQGWYTSWMKGRFGGWLGRILVEKVRELRALLWATKPDFTENLGMVWSRNVAKL